MTPCNRCGFPRDYDGGYKNQGVSSASAVDTPQDLRLELREVEMEIERGQATLDQLVSKRSTVKRRINFEASPITSTSC
jgi:hypothetical protein